MLAKYVFQEISGKVFEYPDTTSPEQGLFIYFIKSKNV